MQDPNELYDPAEASKCLRFLRLLWKFFRCIFSHVTLVSLVVGYCLLGAWAFAELEADHEKEVKKSIKSVRSNVTRILWELTEGAEVLIQENWTTQVVGKLVEFERELVRKMKKDGWDGIEDTENIQWTFAGALFYSIIVITTIGYGHIAPKTQKGKIVTIFYAILGIPLMLLCLSNIGDVMASSFRFLYWKICCYVCTRPPKVPRSRHMHMLARSQSVRQPGRYASSNRSTGSSSFRRSIRTSQRSAETVLPVYPEVIARPSHSDTDCSRCRNCPFDANAGVSGNMGTGGTYSLKETSPHHQSTTSPAPLASPRFLAVGTKIPGPTASRSLDRKAIAPSDVAGAPVLFNKYALDEPDVDFAEIKRDSDSCGLELIDDQVARRTWPIPRRCRSVEAPGRQVDCNNHQSESVRPARISSVPVKRWRNSNRSYRREASSARIMSPMGFAVHRQVYVDDNDFDYDYMTSNELQNGDTTKPVPIWLCVFLVVSYIFGGAFLFNKWENWPFLDSAYFCFITLTTIGFGDLVPAHRLNAEQGIALCSLYLLFGIALLAMSFNLVQEEVINNVKNVAKRLGILKEDHDGENNYDDDDYDPDEDNDNYLLDREEGRYYSEYDRTNYNSVHPEIDRYNDRSYRLKLPAEI